MEEDILLKENWAAEIVLVVEIAGILPGSEIVAGSGIAAAGESLLSAGH